MTRQPYVPIGPSDRFVPFTRTGGMRRATLSLFAILLLPGFGCAGAVPSASRSATAPEFEWREWSAETFAEAERDGKFLLVSVQASWCHWCHVMNDETFGNEDVRGLVAEHYIVIKVDSDARPDLAERFRDYAWPATVILTPNAQVVRALRGYRPAGPFAALLDQARRGEIRASDDWRQGETNGEAPELAALRQTAIGALDALYDEEAAGWGRRQKYPYFGPVEHAFFRNSLRGEEEWETRALATLEGTTQLIDPVFGGVYQYSLRRRWDAPHFEKIAAVQADALSGFALARIHTGDPRWDAPMHDVVRYLSEFFRSSAGTFYTSQDADLSHTLTGTEYYAMNDAERRAQGIPRMDTNIYVDLNAMLIQSLVLAHRGGVDGALSMAETSAEALQDWRREDGGYDHGGAEGGASTGDGLRYLRDQAWMLRAELALFEVTGNIVWKERAERTAGFVLDQLQAERGFYAHTVDPAAVGAFAERRVPLRENGVASRGLLELFRRTAEPRYESAARSALDIGREESVRQEGRRIGDFLMALEEHQAPYVLVSVVGPDDAATEALHAAGVALRLPNRIVEIGRPGTSRYPFPGESSAYLCNAYACSRPVSDAARLGAAAREFLAAE
ncbi:MAG: DUF255 domain-containing protein [Polyangiales bacterium]